MKRRNLKIYLLGAVLLIIACVAVLFAGGRIFSKQEEDGQTAIDERQIEQPKPKTSEDSAWGKQEESKAQEEEKILTEEEELDQRIEEMLGTMSLEDKVSQLFFVTPEALTGAERAVQASDTTKAAMEACPVGGIILFSPNIESEEQLRTMTSNLHAYSRYPLFLGIDEEGGSLVARIANSGVIPVPSFPDMQEIGNTSDPEKAYEVGVTIGGYLKDLGFNVDFAPVADVASNPFNPVIGVRSFGSDANLVSQMVAREVQGMQEQGVSATLKHFPGHGDTSEDSHTETAVSNKTMEELNQTEFLPFRAGIEAGADLVMMGHISVPAVTGSSVPASLSEQIVTGCLRGELGYDGVVITDSMSMGAITDYYSSSEAAVLALWAGCDMILMPQDFTAARQAVLDAVANQTLREERIDESLRRIYRKKLKYNQ